MKNETEQHRSLKILLNNKLEEWFGGSLSEYYDDGHELDVFAVSIKGITIMIEIIWTPSPANFYRDMMIFYDSDANIKILIVNQEILTKDDLVRKFKKTRLKEMQRGFIVSNMINGNLLLENENYLNNDFKSQITSLLTDAEVLQELPIDELKEQGLSEHHISYIISKCIKYAKKYKNQEIEKWLINELYGYQISNEFIKQNINEQIEDGIKKLPNNPTYRRIKFKLKIMAQTEFIEQDYPIFINQPISEIESYYDDLKESNNERIIIMYFPLNSFPEKMQSLFRELDPHLNVIPMEITKNELSKCLRCLRLKIHEFLDTLIS